MYEHTIDRLAAEGLAMYEISNFARPGHESRHNLVYWANDAYFGVGLGAARYVRGVRSSNTRDLPGLSQADRGAGLEATGPTERPRSRGAGQGDGRPDAPPHGRRPGSGRLPSRGRDIDIDALAGPKCWRSGIATGGLIEDDGGRVRLTREGLFLADSVLADLL